MKAGQIAFSHGRGLRALVVAVHDEYADVIWLNEQPVELHGTLHAARNEAIVVLPPLIENNVKLETLEAA